MAHAFQEGAFVNEAVKDRQRMSAAQLKREQATADRRARAWRMAYDRFPHLRCQPGQACPWLVWAICNVWARVGEGRARNSAVLAERCRLLLSRKSWAWDDVTVDPATGRSLVEEEQEAA